MTSPPTTGHADYGRTTPGPDDGPIIAEQPSRPRDRTMLIIVLTISLAGIVTVLIAFQPFAGSAGGCGGG